jgi:hypothetical protein
MLPMNRKINTTDDRTKLYIRDGIIVKRTYDVDKNTSSISNDCEPQDCSKQRRRGPVILDQNTFNMHGSHKSKLKPDNIEILTSFKQTSHANQKTSSY